MAKWLGLHTPLWWPWVSPVQILGVDPVPLLKPTEAASHIAELEGPTTRIYNYALGGFGEREKKDWQQMLARGQSLKQEQNKPRVLKTHPNTHTHTHVRTHTFFRRHVTSNIILFLSKCATPWALQAGLCTGLDNAVGGGRLHSLALSRGSPTQATMQPWPP